MNRFWDKVKKTDSCWFWTAAKRDGYGMYWDKGTNRSAHRYVYEKSVGPIPANKELDHICMNRNCVNPEHLEIVDHLKNLERGRNFKPGTANRKTFLLYIHNPKFRSEREKSKLVNMLLEKHYKIEVYEKLVMPPEVKQDLEDITEIHKSCEHGATKGLCTQFGCEHFGAKRV